MLVQGVLPAPPTQKAKAKEVVRYTQQAPPTHEGNNPPAKAKGKANNNHSGGANPTDPNAECQLCGRPAYKHLFSSGKRFCQESRRSSRA